MRAILYTKKFYNIVVQIVVIMNHMNMVLINYKTTNANRCILFKIKK